MFPNGGKGDSLSQLEIRRKLHGLGREERLGGARRLSAEDSPPCDIVM
jgi:hypothetical protein